MKKLVLWCKSEKRRFLYGVFFLIPLLSITFMEYMSRGSIAKCLEWFKEDNLVPFGLTLLLVYSFFMIIWSLTNRLPFSALITALVLSVLGFINGVKIDILTSPLMPADLKMGSGILGLIGIEQIQNLSYFKDLVWFLFLIFFIIAPISLLFKFTMKYRIKWILRLLSGVVGAITICCLLNFIPQAQTSETAINNYIKNGFLVSFVSNTKLYNSYAKPLPILDNKLEEFIDKYPSKQATSKIKPNVIIVMSEAFWDPTLLPNMSYSNDPIPTFHKLQKSRSSGSLISPTYGGNTSNVEFEIMTGLSMKHLPAELNAYMNAVVKPFPALPEYFKSLGYDTVAVHPYERTFFKRSVIYPMFGIRKFVSQESMDSPELKGSFISDASFADNIIKEFKNGKKPMFMYNISMQNHYPYTTTNYYKNNKFKINTSKDITDVDKTALINYAQGVNDADTSLKKLIKYFSKVKQPTVLVFLGDHLPALTDELRVYKRLGYISSEVTYGGSDTEKTKESLLGEQKLYNTSYILWSNYDIPVIKSSIMSTNNFSTHLLKKLELELPPFYRFMDEFTKRLPVNKKGFSMNSQGETYLDILPKEYEDYDQIYRNIQQDMLFGKQKYKDAFLPKNKN